MTERFPVTCDRFDVVFQDSRPLVLDTQHLGDIGAVKVEIEEADLSAMGREGGSKVDRDR